MSREKELHPKVQDFMSGAFCVMQFLVLAVDEPTLAREIAEQIGIDKKWALKESKRTGFEVRKMNRFIRAEL